jgi:DNA (cytosine-5)-methyltransferase 1
MNFEEKSVGRTFVDLFSGCGGLSLGLSQSGWKGKFAIERATGAFETFRANFLEESSRFPFDWPHWLEQQAHPIDEVLEKYEDKLCELRGAVDLVAGGPPCQGFSLAGKRNELDPRNKMFQRYVAFVELVYPKFLVLENVPGMNIAHNQAGCKKNQTYFQKLHESLSNAGYVVMGQVLDAANFGVPQRRARLIAVGVRSDVASKLASVTNSNLDGVLETIFDLIKEVGLRQLGQHGHPRPVTAVEAISDLEVGHARDTNTQEYIGDSTRRGYHQVKYRGPITSYQVKMSEGVNPLEMDSMRLARHRKDVVERFKKILKNCPPGVNISTAMRAELGMLKHRTVPMHSNKPAPTLTTLPDDVIHYSDPRILTVREYARIQSFPDWFRFKGNYTTGGKYRRHESPRYTQVGNAVPPLLGEAIGSVLMTFLTLHCSIPDSGYLGMADKSALVAQLVDRRS